LPVLIFCAAVCMEEGAGPFPSDGIPIVGRLMVVLALIVMLGLVVVAAIVWLAAVVRRELERSRAASAAELAALRADSATQLAARTGEVDRRLAGLAEVVDRRLFDLDSKVDRRLESAGKTTSEIHERLGKVDAAATQMLDRAKDLARLEQALRPPKSRGGFGEILLENLLRDRLPPSAYAIQHTFSSGDRVDAVVRAGQLIAVDSKFPLDNYNRIVEAQSDDERLLHEKAFARDVRNHIDSIATKYIRPEDGTYDFAFMYVPAESVYYELACGKTGALLHYAFEKRIFPVSPSTFTAYLQVIILGLRGMKIEQHAHEVMAYVAEIGKDFTRFKEDFDLVGTHLGRAQSKFAEADKRLDKFETKLERASNDEPHDLQKSAAVELPPPPIELPTAAAARADAA
jgi:DNA recombination protein RmuC